MEKSEVIPSIHKKDIGAIYLLPIQYVVRYFKKCIYNTIYSYFQNKTIIYSFRVSLVFVNKILVYPSYHQLAITHEIFTNFNTSPSLETRAVFVSIFKAFKIGFGMKVCCSNSNFMVYKIL